MSNNTLVNNTDDTGSSDVTTTSQAKTYTQEEFDRHLAGLRTSLTKKFEKQFEGLGDLEELKALKAQAETQKQEQAMKRGEFDKVMQDLAAKKDAEIAKRDSVIKEYKVNTPLLSSAAKYQAVNADQVKALLINSVRLNSEGEVEVIDDKGAIRYSDAGTALAVDDLVKEFLQHNPHFVQPTIATSSTKSNIANSSGTKIDPSSLDMRNPEHRKKYADLKKSGKI